MDGGQGLGAGTAAVRDSKPDMCRRQQAGVTVETKLYMTQSPPLGNYSLGPQSGTNSHIR